MVLRVSAIKGVDCTCNQGVGKINICKQVMINVYYYYFQQIYKDNLHNPRIALANLGGLE